MTFNQQTKQLVGVSQTDFRDWCKENKRSMNKLASKQEFFKLIQSGKLVRDNLTGRLVSK